MLNRCTFVGRMTRDPEVKKTQGQIPYCNFSIAVDRNYTGQDGKKSTDFIDVVAWRDKAEVVGKFGAKGRLILVEGKLQIREYTPAGSDRKQKAAEIQLDNITFLDKPKDLDKPKEVHNDYSSIRSLDELDNDENLPF